MELLPQELVIQICSYLDNRTVNKFRQIANKYYLICQDIMYNRRKKYLIIIDEMIAKTLQLNNEYLNLTSITGDRYFGLTHYGKDLQEVFGITEYLCSNVFMLQYIFNKTAQNVPKSLFYIKNR